MDFIKTIIIDDEEDARHMLRLLLKKYSSIEIIGEAASVQDGITLIETSNPMLIFLDIELTDGTGFDLLNHFPEANFQLVFITAYDDFAIKAFKYNAIDYLLKPINPLELEKVIQKTQKGIQPNWIKQVDALLSTVKEKKVEKILLGTSEGVNVIKLSEIIHIEAEGSYSIIFLINNERLIVSKNMKELECLLDSGTFFRTHQSYIVNLNYVKKILKDDGGLILLQDHSKIPISRRKKESFLKKLVSFIK